jgi:hypothetical protein
LRQNGQATIMNGAIKPSQAQDNVPEYTPPLALVYEILGIADLPTERSTVAVSTEGLRGLISALLRNVIVDEVWYRDSYPDVAAAVMAGDVPSCREHYIRSGYFEGRLPSEPLIDEEWYLSRYPDLAEARRAGQLVSARSHFLQRGLQEGRAGIPKYEAASEQWIALARARTD